MRAIITVIGSDKIGIVAGVTTELARLNMNIIDINQTIMGEFLTMVLMVDLSKATDTFDVIKKELIAKGEEIGVEIRIQNEEIFNSMHSL